MRILRYCPTQAEFRAYDPVGPEVARLVRGVIQSVEPRLQVEYVGSTSVPGCSGKGIVELVRQNYEDQKRGIFAIRIEDSIEYCKARGEFIRDILKKRQPEG